MRHILTASQFNVNELQEIFACADKMRQRSTSRLERQKLLQSHPGSIMAALFYEPSTRTRLSFESAAHRLGMSVIGTENAAEFSSAAKGETLEDSIRVIAGYADAIVLRHKENGAAKRAAAVSSVPVINAGDGTGEHPTQALLDAYTIQREVGRLQNLHVVIGGDLQHGRTAHSLARLLSLYPGTHLSFVSPPHLAMSQDIKSELKAKGTPFTETADLHTALPSADVVYWTRTQKERHGSLSDATNNATSFVIDEQALQLMQPHATLLHPLPRVDEIAVQVDADPRAAYFRQAENGLYIRMALIAWALS
jgi:aspartate carbamoyltransferase catalytic subunit